MRKTIRFIAAMLLASVLFTGAFPVTTLAAPETMSDGTVFDAQFYADTYPDLRAVFGYNEEALFAHWQAFGKNEGRICVSGGAAQGAASTAQGTQGNFDYRAYADRYPDLKAAFGYNEQALLNHWLTAGMAEGRVGGASAQTNTQVNQVNQNTAFPWKIRVNRAANTVTVYGMDANGAYSIPVKAFVCSAGWDTPLGTFRTSDKVRWLSLVGGVYGQYTTRISGPYWFHSVPYYSINEGNLEYDEYNKLGSLASLGCVRLSVADVKWIYDNCPSGTIVEIYDDTANPGPLGKPAPVRIDVNSANRGWDPTDPNPANPWRQ